MLHLKVFHSPRLSLSRLNAVFIYNINFRSQNIEVLLLAGTFLFLLGLFAAASFQLLLHDPLLGHLRGVCSAQSGHQPRVKELGQVPAVIKNKTQRLFVSTHGSVSLCCVRTAGASHQ